MISASCLDKFNCSIICLVSPDYSTSNTSYSSYYLNCVSSSEEYLVLKKRSTQKVLSSLNCFLESSFPRKKIGTCFFPQWTQKILLIWMQGSRDIIPFINNRGTEEQSHNISIPYMGGWSFLCPFLITPLLASLAGG